MLNFSPILALLSPSNTFNVGQYLFTYLSVLKRLFCRFFLPSHFLPSHFVPSHFVPSHFVTLEIYVYGGGKFSVVKDTENNGKFKNGKFKK